MVKQIVKDEKILTQKSEKFIFGEDDYLIDDMIDTANAHIEHCVGLAAIQIGVPKRVILVRKGDKFIPYINPAIIRKSPKTYIATEGCLSLDGEREVKRHREIRIIYTTKDGQSKCCAFSGLEAQIFQHECDHLNGVLI